MILVRPRAWWYNKVPLSVTLVLLLLDGARFSAGAVVVVCGVVFAVCGAANYGYGLNELFDVEEDARAGRSNAATDVPTRRMWTIIGLSGLCAMFCATVVAGFPGALLTTVELCISPAYSIPPLRVKERRWFGIAADGLAAHVYPAVLALLAVAHWQLRAVTPVLAIAVIAWAAAAGLRGILSHQLHTAENDRRAGLRTVVHDIGSRRLERLVVSVALPLEVGAFGAAVIACKGGAALWTIVALYLIYEAFKTVSGAFRVTAFRAGGQRYVPFVEESFYKAWAPIALALDAARFDFTYLILIPAYAALFGAHLRSELQRFRAVAAALRIT